MSDETPPRDDDRLEAWSRLITHDERMMIQWRQAPGGLDVAVTNLMKDPIEAPRLMFIDARLWSDQHKDFVKVQDVPLLEMIDHPQRLFCQVEETFAVIQAEPGRLSINGLDPREGWNGTTRVDLENRGRWRIDLRLEWGYGAPLSDGAVHIDAVERSLELNWDGKNPPAPTV